MRTAIDTNIISSVWSGEPEAPKVAALLADLHGSGGLTIAAPVYAELLAYPGATLGYLNEFLSSTRISVDFHLDEAVWREGGLRFGKHAARRRLVRAGAPRRLVADFIIGAHALFHADRLLTLDVDLYKQDFPELEIATAN